MLPLGSAGLLALAVLVLSPIVSLIGLFIWSAVVNVFVSLLGGEGGYRETLSVFEYSTAVSPLTALAALIPLVGGIAGLLLAVYQIYIQIAGLMEYHDMSEWRAAGAIILPGILLVGIFVLLTALFIGAMW